MEKKYFNIIVKAGLIFCGAGIGIICFFLLLNFSQFWAYVLGISNLLIISAGYFSIKYVYNVRTRNNVNLVRTAVKNIFQPQIENIPPNNEEFLPLYEDIITIREQLKAQEESRQKIFNIVSSVTSNIDLPDMLEDMVPKILDTTSSNCGAFYLHNSITKKLELKYSLGFNKNIYNEFDITLGEGLVGSIAQKQEIKVIREIPEDTIYISKTFLGNIYPKSLMVVPITNNEDLAGVLVLSSIMEYNEKNMEQAALIRHYLGTAIRNGVTLEANKQLASELKFQNKLIQDFNKELEKKASDRALLFDSIINSIQEYAIYSMDKEGVITTWNKGAEILTGYVAADIIGKHCHTIYPEDEVKNGLVKRRFDIVKNEGRYSEFIWRNKKGGLKYYAEATLYSIKNEKDELIGFTNVTRDITGTVNLENTVQQEKEFRTMLINNSSDAIVVSNDAGYVSQINKPARELLDMSINDIKSTFINELFMDSQTLHQDFVYARTNMTSTTITGLKLKESGNIIDLKVLPVTGNLSDATMLLILIPEKNS